MQWMPSIVSNRRPRRSPSQAAPVWCKPSTVPIPHARLTAVHTRERPSVLSPEKYRGHADLRSTHPGGKNRLIRSGFRLSVENKWSPAIDL